MKKRLSKLSLLLIPLFLFNGCWDYRDINERSIVLSVGLDKTEEGVELNGEIATLFFDGGETKGMSSLNSVHTYNSKGSNFEEARHNYDVKVPAEDFSGAIRVVVFSKEYAQSEGIKAYINRLTNIAPSRRSMLVAISRENTKDLFNSKINNETAIGTSIEGNLRDLNRQGTAVYTTVQDIRSDISFKTIGYVIPYIGFNKNTIEYLGLGVMKDSKLLDIIPVNKTTGLLFITERKPTFQYAEVHPRDDNNRVSLKISLIKRKIKTSYEDNRVKISIDLNLNMQLIYQYTVETLNDKDIKELENMVSKRMKDEVTDIIQKAQQDYNCDIFDFGRYFKGSHYKIYKTLNWDEAFQNAAIEVNTNTKILNTNLINTNPRKYEE